jgi:hypothetical protein
VNIDWYKEVRLKDGRQGCVIEIFDAPDGKEEHKGYMIELSPLPNDSETITVQMDDIECVIG